MRYLGSLLSCLLTLHGFGQQILLSPAPAGCLGGTVPVSFTVVGPFDVGNQFKVTFHDNNGMVAVVTDNVSALGGSIRIPDKIRAGQPYQIQVSSTKPEVGSNFVPFQANTIPSARLLTPATEVTLNPGDPLPLAVGLSGGGPYTLQFTDGQQRTIDNYIEQATLTVFPTESKTYQLATVANNCGVSGTSGAIPVTVRSVGLLVSRLSTTEPCAGQPLLVYYSTDRPLPANTPFRVDFVPTSGGGPTYSATASATGSPLRITVPANVATSGVYRLRLTSDAANVSAYYRDQYDPVASLVTIRRAPTVRLSGGNTTINFGQTAQLQATIIGLGSGFVAFSDGTERPFTAYEEGNAQTIAVQPRQTTTYTIQRVSSGCAAVGAEAGSGSATVTVRTGYRIDSLSSTSVCTGQSFQVYFTTNESAISTNAADYSLRGAARYTGDQLQAGTIDFVVQRVVAGAQPNTGILTASARPLPDNYLTDPAYNRDGALGAGQFFCQLARNGNAGNVYSLPLAVATPPRLLLRSATQTLDRPQLTYLLADLASHASPTELTLSDGSRQTVQGMIDFSQKSSTVLVEALANQTGTFSVASVQNSCGVGVAQGSAQVRVLGDTTAIFMRPLPAILCGTTTVSVAFTTKGNLPANTTYRVEIVEDDGVFKGRYLGAGNASPIVVTIPVGYTLFNRVQVRVVTANPVSGTSVLASAARPFTYIDPTQVVKLSYGGFGATETVIRPGDAIPLRLTTTSNSNVPVELTLSDGTRGTFTGAGTDVFVRPAQTTTYTLRSVRNGCGAVTGTGTVTVRVQPFIWQPQLQQTAYCEGDSLGVFVVAQGAIPANVTHSLQVLLNDNVVQTLPARLVGNRLTSSLPSSLTVNQSYAVRVLSNAGGDQFYSQPTSGSFRFYRIPRLQLTPPNNQTAVVLEANQNSVNIQLTDPSGTPTILPRPYQYRINDQFYSPIATLPTTVPLFANSARPTSYSVSGVYDSYCGFGVATGSVRVSFKPGLRSLAVNKAQFCRNGDQATVSYEVAGDFTPTDRFTVFLTSTSGNRIRVAESANAIDRLTFPINASIPSGTYLVSLVSSVTGLPGFDNTPTIVVGDVPSVVIAGGNAIQYADQPVTVGVRVASGFLPVSVTFTSGTVQTLNTADNVLTFSPQQSSTYQVARVSNSCGVGAATGSVSVTVLPNATNELRVTTISPTGGLQGICQGGTVLVTFEAKGTFGTNNTYTVYLSDTTGLNYQPLPTRLVSANMLSVTLPANVSGSGYRLRIGGSNPAVLGSSSTILTIRPGLVATIAGPTQAYVNELVPIVITLNNSGPWSLTLTNSIYGMEVLTINESPFFYRVRPDATTTYTLQSVFNLQCGLGRATGSLTVTVVNPLAVDPNLPIRATVAPNPTQGQVRVWGPLPSAQRVSLHLTDMQGRALWQRDLGTLTSLDHEVDLSQLPAGQYLLSVTGDAGQTVFKVVKQ
ncbi:T9SS type A sorting domain-containing protein [Fibrella sp. WM1]|uniref:T9SS type A sorting domain-containing protein n=1 Tax=Fibrella musci TaxID=3242485 RepID=UPI0035220125